MKWNKLEDKVAAATKSSPEQKSGRETSLGDKAAAAAKSRETSLGDKAAAASRPSGDFGNQQPISKNPYSFQLSGEKSADHQTTFECFQVKTCHQTLTIHWLSHLRKTQFPEV